MPIRSGYDWRRPYRRYVQWSGVCDTQQWHSGTVRDGWASKASSCPHTWQGPLYGATNFSQFELLLSFAITNTSSEKLSPLPPKGQGWGWEGCPPVKLTHSLCLSSKLHHRKPLTTRGKQEKKTEYNSQIKHLSNCSITAKPKKAAKWYVAISNDKKDE